MRLKSLCITTFICVSIAGIISSLHSEAALGFSIGNYDISPFEENESAARGQSFTPSVPGNAGIGTAPISGSVILQTFTFGATFGDIYILDRRYSGLPSELSASTPGYIGQGSATNFGVYGFGSGLTLPSVNTRYFAFLGFESDNGRYTTGNAYTGGGIMVRSVDGNTFTGSADNNNVDYIFAATFSTPVEVPFEFNPSLGIGILVAFWGVNKLKGKIKL